MIGRFEVKERDQEGQMVKFAKLMEMSVVNPYNCGSRSPQVDYILWTESLTEFQTVKLWPYSIR